jgi:endonuclease/exonuclease/phosphatase family metal-dependent hydrolase
MRLLRIIIGLALAFVPMPAHADSQDQITVMTRNMYLGADVGPAMKLLPDFSAAAEFMWKQVKQTDFSKRSVAMAREISSAQPDVIALQEATKWICTPHVWSKKKVVFDFTSQLIEALHQQGDEYKLASAKGTVAFNTGFSINPIPGLTMVSDPETFQPLFGTNKAACGFQIADALLVKADLEVTNVGTSEYKKIYTIIPTIMTVYRGYSWADISFDGNVIRFVATHLESLFDEQDIPIAKIQADQLVADTSAVNMPLVVMGDFNSDPRDPRPATAGNLGGQPKENDKCKAQVSEPVEATAIDVCNAYWTMLNAGFMDSGPDPLDQHNLTWGYDALLAGPSADRPAGMTDRLDYVFTKNFRQPISASVFGNRYPQGIGMWDCGSAKCAASDHAGVVVTLHIPTSTVQDAALPGHAPFPVGFWKSAGLLAALIIPWLLRRRRIKKRQLL